MRRLLVVALVIVALLAVGCQSQQDVININGSDTMVNMGAALAEAFMNSHKGIEVVVTGGGSGTGIAALINGNAHIAQSSRAMRESEKSDARSKGQLHEIIVGYDGLAVAVHPSNPVRELTLEQVAKIYRGEITNWSQVGGNDAAIVLLSRDTTSGTHVFFKEFVLQEDGKNKTAEFAPQTMMMPSTQAIVDELGRSVNAIGYVGLGYLKPGIQALAVRATPDASAILPSVESVQDKSYGLARPLYFYAVGSMEGSVKTYVDFVLGSAGQKVIRDLQFVPAR